MSTRERRRALATTPPKPAPQPGPIAYAAEPAAPIPWAPAGLAHAGRGETLLAVAVILASGLITALWAAILPYNESNDEFLHFQHTLWIADHDRLPVFDGEDDFILSTCDTRAGPCYTSYASQHALSYVIASRFIKAQQDLFNSRDNLFYGARVTGVLATMAYVLFLWLTARLLFSDRLTRVTALMLGAFIPQVSFIGAYVNSDIVSLAIGSAVVYLTVRLLKEGLHLKLALYLGVALGLLGLAKYNYSVLLAPAGIAMLIALIAALRERGLQGFGRFALLCLPVVAICLAICGWWYVRGADLYDDPFGLKPVDAAFDKLAPFRQSPADKGETLITIIFDDPKWAKVSFQSFWGTFGYTSVPLDERIYIALEVMCLLALGGLLVGARQALATQGSAVLSAWKTQAWLLLALLLPAVVLISATFSLNGDFQPQGRYLFAALVPAVLLLAAGLHALWDGATYRQTVTIAVSGGMVLLNLFSLAFVLAPVYY